MDNSSDTEHSPAPINELFSSPSNLMNESSPEPSSPDVCDSNDSEFTKKMDVRNRTLNILTDFNIKANDKKYIFSNMTIEKHMELIFSMFQKQFPEVCHSENQLSI